MNLSIIEIILNLLVLQILIKITQNRKKNEKNEKKILKSSYSHIHMNYFLSLWDFVFSVQERFDCMI